MNKTPTSPATGPIEPVLPMSDIQGIAAPGFLKPHQTLLGVTFGADPASVSKFKDFLGAFPGEIPPAAATLEDRRSHRGDQTARAAPKPLTGIAFTFQGLGKLTPGAAGL